MALRRTLVGLVAAPALLLAGCGGDSSVADPPVQSSPTSSSPTSDPPAHETAEHFIRRWLAIGTRMQNTGDPTAYVAMTSQCRDCEAVAKKVRDAYQQGGFYKTKGIRSLSIHPEGSSSNKPVFAVLIDFYPTRYKTSSSSKVKHFAGGPGHFQIGLTGKDTKWQVVSFAQVAK